MHTEVDTLVAVLNIEEDQIPTITSQYIGNMQPYATVQSATVPFHCPDTEYRPHHLIP